MVSKFLFLKKNINYIEVIQKTCYLHIKNKEELIEIRQTLHTIKSKLTLPIFIQPHRSYIVNMNYIASIQSNQIHLIDGVQIPLSRNTKETCLQQYEDFLLKQTLEARFK